MLLTKKPVEEDFNAMNLFRPQPDEVFLDIGANRGNTILSMLSFPGFENEIIGFEPNPLVYQKIKTNKFLQHDRVSVLNYGLGSKDETLTLYIPFYKKWMFDGLASFSFQEAHDWLVSRLWNFKEEKLKVEQIKCEVKKLDDFKTNPYFIKIDVQGFELQVLKGGVETITAHRPILLIEAADKEIENYLQELGYAPFKYENSRFIPGYGGLNTFFIPKNKMEELKLA